jgi:type VII secretion protein EccE
MTTTGTVPPPRFVVKTTGDRPGRLGRVQLVVIELAVIAVGAAVFAGRPVWMIVAGGTMLLLLVVTLGRSRRRWLYEAVAARRRLRHRHRSVSLALSRPDVATDPGAGTRSAELTALMPSLTIRAVTDRGSAIGVGQDDLGWFAAMAIAPWTGLSGSRGTTVRLDRIARLLADDSVPVSTLQLATHRVPAPSAWVDERTACAVSYRELLGGTPGLAEEESWIAVRLGPRDAVAAAAHRGGGLTGVDRALVAALGRVGAALTAAGVPHRVLDAGGLRQALAIACGVQWLAGGAAPAQSTAQPVASTLPGAVPVAERWTHWQADGVLHACFAIEGWPAQPDPDLTGALAAVPNALAVNSALVLRSVGPARDDGLAVRALLRIVAGPDQLTGCVQHLLATAQRLGVRLNRLDGEHGTGVYATAPTGARLGASPW